MNTPRLPETEKRYLAFLKKNHEAQQNGAIFTLENEVVLREFTNWIIIENRFPYDGMAKVNHMLIPRDPVTDFYTAPAALQDEYHAIRRLLSEEAYYDAIIENFPRSRSVTRHTHSHLVVWLH